jgi:hypothetical protein
MVFTLTFGNNAVSCSSPSCVQRHLELGWRLADPAQAEDLLEALDGVHDVEPARAHLPEGPARGPMRLPAFVPEEAR